MATIYTFLANIISILILFITWSVFKYVDLPVKTVSAPLFTTQQTTVDMATLTVTSGEKTIEMEASFGIYIIALMSFFGWIFLVLFGGVGLFALPIDLINEFRHRPKARKTAEMKRTKDNLVRAVGSLLK